MATYLTESQARARWGPPCENAQETVNYFGHTLIVAKGTARAFKRRERLFKKYAPTIANMMRMRADVGTFNCRKIGGSSTWSNHAFKVAIDELWQLNPYGNGDHLFDHSPGALKVIRKLGSEREQLFFWGGKWGTQDDMHSELMATKEAILRRYTPKGYIRPFYAAKVYGRRVANRVRRARARRRKKN